MRSGFVTILAALATLTTATACSEAEKPESDADTAANPLASLAIEEVAAQAASDVPIATVPGTVTLPPEARVAVTATYAGSAVRVYVIEGQSVSRGQPLAIVRAAEPVAVRGDLARARSALDLAEARAKRLGQLADEGIIALARADEAKAQAAQARATLSQQQRLASLAGVGPDGTMTLSAPITGRVAHVGVETGGSVGGMEAPFVIEAAGSYQVEMQLPERLANNVRPGMAVEILLSAQDVSAQSGGEPIPVGGRILAVAPSIDPATRSILARASIGAAPGIVAGRNVQIVIKSEATQDAIVIPASAITRIGGDTHVFVRDGETYKPREVVVAATNGADAVIASGLNADEMVAVSAVTELKAMSAE